MKIRLDPGAYMPERCYPTDAGMDLKTPKDFFVKPGCSYAIDTGVHMELPPCTYGKVESKSGLNINDDVVCCGGVVDEGYTGSIVVKLYNLGKYRKYFKAGDKIAQLLVCPVAYVPIEIVEEIQGGERGDNGFGSTGR